MKIKVGKKYLNRNGEVIEIFDKITGCELCFLGRRVNGSLTMYFGEKGNFYVSGESQFDLIEEQKI